MNCCERIRAFPFTSRSVMKGSCIGILALSALSASGQLVPIRPNPPIAGVGFYQTVDTSTNFVNLFLDSTVVKCAVDNDQVHVHDCHADAPYTTEDVVGLMVRIVRDQNRFAETAHAEDQKTIDTLIKMNQDLIDASTRYIGSEKAAWRKVDRALRK